VEITAELPIRQFRPLLAAMGGEAVSLTEPARFEALLRKLGLEARVRLVATPDIDARWEGRLIRIAEEIDPLRSTIGLVVAVDKPYEGVVPGVRPPLLKGMYMAVEFLAPPRPALVIPRSALHEGRVYLARPDDRLEIRPVEIAWREGEFVVLRAGVEPGERLLLSDVIPVIEGLPLKPVEAGEFRAAFARRAAAEPAQ